MKLLFIIFLLLIPTLVVAQTTKVEGVVKDAQTGEILPFVTVRFKDSKIGAYTDTVGYYMLDTYYATDSLVFSMPGYRKATFAIKKDVAQVLNVELLIVVAELEEVVIKPPDEFPSTILHKRVVANKPINNKEKLSSYEYEVYNKVQLDLNNIGENFEKRDVVQRLELVMDYLDSTDNGKSYLPVVLSESVSNYYFKKDPKEKKEIVKATRTSGVENMHFNQFLGDMYLDINIYDNYFKLFNKDFISPVANFARSFYKFYLTDSMYIGNQWCYQLTFKPKRSGDMTLEGEMWIHDTTYAVKSFKAHISPWANINYVQDLYIEHEFEMVAPEIWMLTSEKMIADLKITRNTDVYGFFGRRTSSRKNFIINQPREEDFYKSTETVVIEAGADKRSDEYWAEIRHTPLSQQEQGIDNMIDSLSEMRFFKNLKNLLYFATTGYYPIGKIEIGNAFSFISFNPVEEFRSGLAIRTSNSFSRRIEFGGKVAYGTLDERFKYGASIRYNVTPKKRGMLVTYYNYDLEQIGQSPTAAALGSTFGTLLRTGPLDKLTFVEKAGINLEKDIRKDVILYGGFEWKEYTPLGLANYIRMNPVTGLDDTISRIQTTEFIARFRWAKNEEFLSGSFDRTSVGSKYPIISIQGIFGVKDLFGADYNYQKVDLNIEHTRTIGIFGRIRYGVYSGIILGSVAYPFLKVHEGNQSYWLMTSVFNKLNYFEFISDKHVTCLLENHWDGFFLDRIPFNKKLKWRLVTTFRATYGTIDSKHSAEMKLPEFTKSFNNVPYAEFGLGIENIFKVGRVDIVWRLTHHIPGESPFGFRARYAINF